MSEPSTQLPEEPRDRLSIARLFVLTAGIAVALAIVAPRAGWREFGNLDDLVMLATAVIIGLTLPAPLFCFQLVRSRRRLGPGGMFALASGMGVLLLLPAAAIERFWRPGNSASDDNSAILFHFVLASTGLWYLLAALMTGDAGRRLFRRDTPWIERYGFLLALLWSPLGAWQLYDIYEALL